LFRDDEITPEHLLASCSIPVFYPTVHLNGRRMVDGGVLESTPVWAAAAMGATRVIAINALPGLTPWPFRMVLSRLHRLRKMPVPKSLEVSVIVPSGRMGTVRDAVVWERGNILRWLKMGIGDGEEFLRAGGGI
jgi:NTE family protein